MSLQRLQSPEILNRIREPRPLERTTDPRLQRNLNGVAAQIKRPVESIRLEKHLSIAKSCTRNRPEISGSDHGSTRRAIARSRVSGTDSIRLNVPPFTPRTNSVSREA